MALTGTRVGLFRLLLWILLAGVVPAGLARAGAALYFEQREAERVEAALASMRRTVSELSGEIVRQTPRGEIARDLVRRLSAEPLLDAAAVARVRDEFANRHPGLVEMAFFAGTTNDEGQRWRAPVEFVPSGGSLGGSATVALAFARFLYHYWIDGDRAETPRWKTMAPLVSAQLLGGRTDPRTVASGRGEPHAVLVRGRPAHIAWELVGRLDGGLVAWRGDALRGMLVALIDDAAYGEHFSDDALLARKQAAAGAQFGLGFLLPDSGVLPPPLDALGEAARAELLAGIVRTPTVAGEATLAAFAPLPDADGRILYAAMPRAAADPGGGRARRLVDAALVAHLMLVAALALLIARGRFAPFLPVALQASAFLVAAALPALAALYYFGVGELRGGRRLAETALAERLAGELSAFDASLAAHMGKLLREGLALRDRLAAGEPFAAVEEDLRRMRKDGVLENYLIFSASGETMLKGDRKGDETIALALRMVALAALDEFNAAAGGVRRERASLTTMLVDKLSKSSGFTEKIMMHRGRLHRLNLGGQEICLLLEPIGPAGAADAAAAFVFDVRSVRRAFNNGFATRSHEAGAGAVRLYAAHTLQRFRRYPDTVAFPAELNAFLDRLIETRTAAAESLETPDGRMLAVGRPLVEAPEYVAVALLSRDEAERQVAARVRLFQIAFLATLLSAFAAAVLLARRVVTPVRRLERGVAAVIAGDYAVRVEHASRDEFGALATTFNEMARGLEEKERMSRYVSEFVRDGVKHGDGAPAARRAKCAVLFCDIRSFTTLTETHPPEEIVMMLNGYFDRMTAAIRSCGGVVDKFIGDAVMAVFPSGGGAGEELRAVCAALLMRRELTRYNAERRAAGKFEIDNGVGISTGEVIMGDIGSLDRLDHTVIGDHVNLAARLEALAREGAHTRIILDGDTRDAVDPFIATAPLGDRTVKGKTRAVAVVEVVGPRAAAALAPLLESPDPAVRALGAGLSPKG